jgi:tryptophan synthase alpha chain
MNRIEQRFAELAEHGKKAFIPYITAGDPNLERTGELLLALESAGADVVEFGVPFSDPIADGPVNQEAAQRALLNHVTLHHVVALVKQMRARTKIPVVLFTYFNPVLSYGLEAFAKDCADAGVDGVLCVDLPPEEADEYKRLLDEAGVATVFLLAPTSTEERMELVARQSTGFIYYVSRTGVTGTRESLDAQLHAKVDEIRAHTNKPIAVGFGISTPEQAREVAEYADGVIVGSAIVRMIGELGDAPDMPKRVGEFARSLVEGVKGEGAVA